MRRLSLFVSLLLLVALLLGGCSVPALTTVSPSGVTQQATPTSLPTQSPNPSPGLQGHSVEAVAALEGTLSSIYQRVNPSVVHVRVVKRSSGVLLPGQPPELVGSGSGFVWDKQGHIVTNNHVVEGAEDIRVTFADGRTVPAKVVGTDPDSDLAVIHVDVAASELHPVRVADSTRLKVGQLAIAIGNPFALTGTMTVGIVSALGRALPTETSAAMGAHYVIPDVIQTDAAINPGNSGGPLLNSRGQVIGVTSAIISPVRASVGIGFAIPSVIVNKVVPKLIKEGHYDHPWLGVSVVTLDSEMAKAMNLPQDQRGALIQQVIPNSPADKAGLRGSDRTVTVQVGGQEVQLRVGGDVVIAVDGRPVRTSDDLVTYLARYTEAHQKITLRILRDGKKMPIKVILGVRPTQPQRGAQTAQKENPPRHQAWLGILGVTVTPEIAQTMNLPADQGGVLIEAVVQGSPADKAGLRGSYKPVNINGRSVLIGGDIIMGIDGQPVKTLDDLVGYLQQKRAGDQVTLKILRQGSKVNVKVTLGERPANPSGQLVMPGK